MVCEDDVIVEFFTDYPERVERVFEIFANVELIVCLVDCQEAELGFLGYAF